LRFYSQKVQGLKLYTKPYLPLVVLIIAGLVIFQGCYKFSGTQTVPAYLSIDAFNVTSNYAEEGTNSSKITDVWVYVDDGLIGVFELPAMFPVLAEGKHKLEIRPGIKINGISSTRVPYPFYSPIVYDEFDFVPEQETTLGTLTTSYATGLKFQWMEDFEQPDISFQEISTSDTVIKRTSPENNPEAFLSPNSRYSGVISLTEEKPVYGAASYNSFDMPTSPGAVVVLEMDVKTNNIFSVSLLMRIYDEFKEIPLLFVNYSDEWTKIYINLGPNISLNPNASDYKVLFRAEIDPDVTDAEMYIDNLKIVSR